MKIVGNYASFYVVHLFLYKVVSKYKDIQFSKICKMLSVSSLFLYIQHVSKKTLRIFREDCIIFSKTVCLILKLVVYPSH